jgi:hypothetical protein
MSDLADKLTRKAFDAMISAGYEIIPFNWEKLEEESCYRAKVIGGWIFHTKVGSGTSCFIPDPTHKWIVNF